MQHRFQKIALVVSCAGIISLLSASSAWAGPFREVVDECKSKYHLGDSTCMSIIRNNLTVENCMERSGLSEAECKVKIEDIKDDPEFSGKPALGTPKVPIKKPAYNPSNFSGRESTESVAGAGTLAQLRTKKERDLQALWEKTQFLTNLLKEQGVGVGEIEAAFPEFERRSEALLAAYDTYRSVYEGTIRDTATTRAAMRSRAQEPLEQAIRELVEYYEEKILLPLRAASERSL